LHKRMAGADHFVLAYRMDQESIEVHDPEGFPSVRLSLDNLEAAWKAEKIGYRCGYYRYWANPRRLRRDNSDTLYTSALEAFRDVYHDSEKIASENNWTIDRDAILTLAKRVRTDKVTPGERGFMVHFSLKLGARRALDFARFFSERNQDLAVLKNRQAELFGQCQAQAVARRWSRVADLLTSLADIESQFKDSIMTMQR
jgi:hypothetical protein